MNTIPFNKNILFSLLLAIVTFAIVNRIVPASVDHVFDAVISKNRSGITNIHQNRDIERSKTLKLDRINLAEKSRFRHPKLGDIGYSDNFFVDIEAPFTVKKAGDYVFYLGSDDGFTFSVDGQPVCEYAADRPLSTNICNVNNLTTGRHIFKLTYFQGSGNAGLTMNYAYAADGKQYVAGDNSKYMSF